VKVEHATDKNQDKNQDKTKTKKDQAKDEDEDKAMEEASRRDTCTFKKLRFTLEFDVEVDLLPR
jgi:hypothetical protein